MTSTLSAEWEAHHHHEPDNKSHWLSDPDARWVKPHGKQINISVEAMNIAWGNDNRFWKWVKCGSDEISGFETAAEMIQVSWLEVKGSLDLELRRQTDHDNKSSAVYDIIYHIKFNADAFGWHDLPVVFTAIVPGSSRGENTRTENLELHRWRSGSKGWIEINGGQFELPAEAAADPDSKKGKVEFGMKNTTKRWKGGIQIAGVSIRPARCSSTAS